MPWVKSEKKDGYYRYVYGEEPEVLHIVRTGFVEESFMVFTEDPFYTPSSINFYTRDQIIEIYGIELPKN